MCNKRFQYRVVKKWRGQGPPGPPPGSDAYEYGAGDNKIVENIAVLGGNKKSRT